MYLRHFILDQFRSYGRLDQQLSLGTTLIIGDNAAGKSNLLEAIYMLATTRSPRAVSDGELVPWNISQPTIVRIEGKAVRSDGEETVEIALAVRSDAQGVRLLSKSGVPLISKRLRLNGIPRRAPEIMGRVLAVLFSTLDIEILSGSPLIRRRYLDLVIAQYLTSYAESFSRYSRAVTQRNAVLKRIGAGEALEAELEPWNEIVVDEGAAIMAARSIVVQDLRRFAKNHHRRMAEVDVVQDGLVLTYHPAIGNHSSLEMEDRLAFSNCLRNEIELHQRREISAGRTLVGPHRDDLAILLNGRSVSAYASRAQQRSVVLALRLAEADVLRKETNEHPLILLDDVFSELDPSRREATATAISDADQILVTTADEAWIPSTLLTKAKSFQVTNSLLMPL